MSAVYIVADNIYSPIGATTAENFEQVKQGISGIKQHHNTALADEPVYASLFDCADFKIDKQLTYTRFERLLIASVEDALKDSGIEAADKKTVLILSSTKGNISLLETEADNPELNNRIAMHTSAKLVAAHFGFVNQPLVVSNACISGIMAILTGMRLVQSGQYENAVIVGADIITKFVLSGFQSFQAISTEPCRPFDKNRTGITLGEGAATMVLSSNAEYSDKIKVLGGAVSNDANHISAPSRTGKELKQAIEKALSIAGLKAGDIDLVSAHGTATSYNDEMEAKAIALAGLDKVPLNSLKGYYGHTLGAAGLIESIISIQSLKQNLILPTLGFKTMGVSDAINVCTKLTPAQLKTCLKTASGFGGCNAAVVFSK
ncbi:beta-ketoacyl-[acyl-carrier-protein] synthase family protein [Mucilaginibacter sp.]|uniref:beta-ketoacyl-[acyl-carrier-protein] synthase family protein n=1 Tax=Mucilaginibacter sp. TaxID=1882438 RepID=UPI00261A71E8|nr:beta-ketoacyl-[acyl-carrier-protein] synthase family protein [Mucilaginibacter sp.]MDB5030682.1 3-oxoacyl-acyl-carrier-protein synthase [Mucilaginibacter sp.]